MSRTVSAQNRLPRVVQPRAAGDAHCWHATPLHGDQIRVRLYADRPSYQHRRVDGLNFIDPDAKWPPDDEPDREDLSAWRYNAEGYDEEGWRRSLQPSEWRRLQSYEGDHLAEPGDTEMLRAVLDGAEDERPLQQLMEERPRLVSAAFGSGGHGRFVRPQVRLGSQYVADFMLADTSSMGMFWTLVELESPREPMFLKSGEFAAKARHAIYQVQSWRRWLAENIDYARKPPAAGLDLIDVESSPHALILIGRRSTADADADWLRRDLLKNQRIRMHSYDELVDRVARTEATRKRSAERANDL
jgi:hypothetical protein